MILYHGSTDLVEKPEIRPSEKFLDFGVGFYTTTSLEQAERWTHSKMKKLNKNTGYVSIYEFDFELAKKSTNIKEFPKADEEWLRFVTNNRNGAPTNDFSDMHIGPVADDNVYQSIRLFETGVLNIEETIKKLQTEELHDQWVFHTNTMLYYLKFIESKKIRKED